MITRNMQQLRQLQARIEAVIELLEEEPEDIAIAWELTKFLHRKTLKVLTAEKERMKKFKEQLMRP